MMGAIAIMNVIAMCVGYYAMGAIVIALVIEMILRKRFK